MAEPIEVRIGRQLARRRSIVVQWFRRHLLGLSANSSAPLAEPASPSAHFDPGTNTEPATLNRYDVREVEARAIGRFCRELASHSIQRRHELIQRKLLDLSLRQSPEVAI